jgi:hypothetical protein
MLRQEAGVLFVVGIDGRVVGWLGMDKTGAMVVLQALESTTRRTCLSVL